MKKKLLVVLIALLMGGGIAYFMFSRRYLVEEDTMVKVSAFQVGVFSNYDNALKVADRNNGIVVDDGDLYRVYVSILSSSDAVSRMRGYYDSIGLNYYLKEIMVSEDYLIKIEDGEELLATSNVDAYNVINLSVLSSYEEFL